MSGKGGEIFLESSALVALLVREERGPSVAAHLRAAAAVWLSALAPAESSRALHRAAAAGSIDPGSARAARRRLATLASGCRIVPVDADILLRAGQSFPLEPVRTLDAIHLASLERAHRVTAKIALLAFDDRVRNNAAHMGVTVLL